MDVLNLAAAEAAAHGEGSAGGLPQLDLSTWPSQLFWLAVFFGALYVAMSAYFLPRIGRTIEERRDRIASDLDKAAEQRAKAEAAEKAYEQALADATARAQAIAADTRGKLNAEIAELSAAADREAGEALARAEARIAAMKQDASRKVREAAVDTSVAIVAALIGETPTRDAAAAMSQRVEDKEVA
ncbi:MAG: F0F1 ATP synthase subunit B' [Parvularculaceae bacterium]|jgi:F-type H+-transporting ATPase subunit b|nr:F0F1 ATP synthase subunit B' [Parvularculaceae bacterium]